MGRINITQRVRPIKFLFLVHPDNKEGLLDVISMNSFLWGGIFNPILPAYLQKPKHISRETSDKSSYFDLIQKCTESYEPDYVVAVGDRVHDKYNQKVQNYRVLSLDDFFGKTQEEDHSLLYGIDIREVLKTEDNELYPQFITPESIDKYDLFHRITFGHLNDRFSRKVNKYDWAYKEWHFEFQNFENRIKSLRRSILHYTSSRLSQCEPPSSSKYILILDPAKVIDLLDFWNLRARYGNVLPIPYQKAKNETLHEYLHRYFDGQTSYFPSLTAKKSEGKIIKGRNVKDDQFQEAVDSILSPFSDDRFIPFVDTYPSILSDEVTLREPNHVEVYSREEISAHRGDKEEFILEYMPPDFVEQKDIRYYRGRTANDLIFHQYRTCRILAEIFPKEIHPAIFGNRSSTNWKIKSRGLSYLNNSPDENIDFRLPEILSNVVDERILGTTDLTG